MIYGTKTELVDANIKKTDVVLDVGFVGQGVTENDANWVHALLKRITTEVYGIDLEFDDKKYPAPHYQKASAESFHFPEKFDVIFAGDLIEHLSNQGLFLALCRQHLKVGGRLILTTPNCFNLFNLASKFTHYEPTTNKDHTCYYNVRTLKQLLGKNGFTMTRVDYLYSLENQSARKLKEAISQCAVFSCIKIHR
jgi:2-polyprenyl-3-methyl-5-hydroxy-6-metoxy-1,4-benzoquinol methylase